jgi:hypothetical protein
MVAKGYQIPGLTRSMMAQFPIRLISPRIDAFGSLHSGIKLNPPLAVLKSSKELETKIYAG